MPRIDLVTGFLGAGKTTFLKKYVSELAERGQQIGILENDLGAVNVDTMLLKPLESDRVELESVAGGCDADCHRRRFKTKLIAMGMTGYDRVIVEPSGIYDADEFYDALYEEPLDRWYTLGSVIAIVDAALEEDLPEEAMRMLASQVSGAGLVVLSRVQETSPERIERTISLVNTALENLGSRRRLKQTDVLAKDWAELTKEDYDRILQAGSRQDAYISAGRAGEEEGGFHTLYYMHVDMRPDEAETCLKDMLNDPACGNIFRIKGFLTEGEGYLQLNATREAVHLEHTPFGQEVWIVIGEHLCKAAIDAYIGGSQGDA